MAFAIEMLVKGRFLASAGVGGYDGGGTMLIHTRSDIIAVIALVHDRGRAGFEMFVEQGLALIEVGDIGPGEDEAQGIAQGIAGKVDLGGKTGSGAAHGVGRLPAHRSSCILVHPSARAVDHQIFIVALGCTQVIEHCLPSAIPCPAAKRRIDGFPRAKAGGQISPRCSRSHDPQDGFDLKPFILTFAPTASHAI